MHVPEDDLVLHYYGELAPQDESRVSAHIAECHDCHAAYRRLQQVLMSVDDTALGVPELPEGFERVGVGSTRAESAIAGVADGSRDCSLLHRVLAG